MAKRERKGRRIIKIKELPAKIKIVREISPHSESQRLSGLEQREEAAEREFTSAAQASATSSDSAVQALAITQQRVTAGNTALQQSPQEDSDEVRRWYATNVRLALERHEESYRVPLKRDFVQSPQATSGFGTTRLGENSELTGLRGSTQDNEETYDLTKPEKKETHKRYPWEA